jgi:hypothetical protein
LLYAHTYTVSTNLVELAPQGGGGGAASLKTALFEDVVNTFRTAAFLYFKQFFRYGNKQYAIP